MVKTAIDCWFWFPERMSLQFRYFFLVWFCCFRLWVVVFFSSSQLTWKLCGNWNIHTVEILMSPTNFSLQNWAQDVCQEDCPLGILPVGGLARLLDLAFIERFLTVSVPVEVCFYKSAFFYRNKKKIFLEFLTIGNEEETLKGNWGILWPHPTVPSKIWSKIACIWMVQRAGCKPSAACRLISFE